MDPLSIAASSIGILGFAAQCAQGLSKLMSLRHASLELLAICNEISDLETVLTQVIELGHRLQTDQEADMDGPVAALLSLLKSGEDQIRELHNLVQGDLRKTKLTPSGQIQASKISWFFNQERAIVMQQRLRTARLNIATALGIVNSRALTRVELMVQSISASQATDSELLKQIRDTLNSQSHDPDLEKSPLFPNSSTARLWNHNVTPTQTWMAQPDPGKLVNTNLLASVNIKARARIFKVKCRAWCSCACHTQRIVRYPEWLKKIVGGLFIGYSGLPVFTPTCTEALCNQRSAPSIEVTYHFPSWFLSRVLSFNLRLSSLAGPEMNLRMPRMVNWTTPLWQKAATGDHTSIQTLFSTGVASPYDVNAYGQSALHYAADISSIELCRFLIENNADVYLRDENGRRPIDYAWSSVLTKNTTQEVAVQMTEIFSDDEYLETRQFSVFHKIVLDLVPTSLDTQVRLSSAQLDAVDVNGRTSLAWAAARGDSAAVATLLEYGANDRIVDMEGNTPLHHAVQASAIECVSILIGHATNLQTKNVFGSTALHVACATNDVESIVELLINEAHIDINTIDYDGDTALIYAARAGSIRSARVLLEAGADSAIANVGGDTAIHMSIMWRTPGVLSELAKPGFEASGRNARGQTLLHVLASHFDPTMLDVLRRVKALRGIDTSILDTDGKTCFDLLQQGHDEHEINERIIQFQLFLDGLDGETDDSDAESFVDAVEDLAISR